MKLIIRIHTSSFGVLDKRNTPEKDFLPFAAEKLRLIQFCVPDVHFEATW